MKPLLTLAETSTPGGSRLTLHEHDGDILLKLNGRQLMSSAATRSETRLAEIACKFHPPIARPRILIGGLGLGYTLRRVLELANPAAIVHVAEYIPEVVTWNRELLGPESKAALEDPRVTVLVADVFKVIKHSDTPLDRYDAILLDVDNGPVAMVASGNSRLYNRHGIASIARALRPRGRAAIWSADQDDPFSARLVQEGFIVTPFEAKPHDRAKRAAHRIYLAELRA
ncbi:MAG: hypothetical protein WCD79_02170 [Chthoniobacteraceae bacterium]